MASKRQLTKKSRDSYTSRPSEAIPEVAVAAILSSKKQKDVNNFITFFLSVLEKHSDWLNKVVNRYTNFKCAMMVGAGPNRYQLQEIIYPLKDKPLKLEVELKGSEDHDKLAIAALLKITDSELNRIKSQITEKSVLKEDLLAGKSMGVTFAILKPFTETQYRVMERLVIDSLINSGTKKRRRNSVTGRTVPIKKAKHVF